MTFYNFQFSFLSIPYIDTAENAISANICEATLIKHLSDACELEVEVHSCL
jgi:hypothetical protein